MNKLKVIGLIFLNTFFMLSVKAQIPVQPQPQIQPAFNLSSILGGQPQQQNQLGVPQDTGKPEAAKPDVPEQDKEKLKTAQDLELENRLMELRKERLTLEMELAELQNSGNADTTIQDSINLAIKKKNLEFALLREQVLLKIELEKYGLEKQTYPSSGVFGQSYFRNPKLRMLNAPKDIAPSENYILGTGDKVQVDIWGKAGYSGNFTIQEGGFITIPRKQRVYLKGRSLTEARVLLKSRFGQLVDLKGSSFDVSVSHTRTITVHITGEVFFPGTYTLSALNSVFNVLSVAGGPKNSGTVREILLQRGGMVIDTFDLYEYLFNPKGDSEKFLQNNDKLIIPLSGKKVSISGPVKRPGTFELKNEENTFELIGLTGGFEARAFLDDVVLKRFVSNSHAEVFTLNLDSLIQSGQNFALQDGDNISLKSLTTIFEDLIELGDGVMTPGIYQLQEGDRVSDIINRAGGLSRNTYLKNAYILRTNDDLTEDFLPFKPMEVLKNEQSSNNYKLQFRDELRLFTKNQFFDKFFVKSSGSLRMPSSIPYKEGITANMLIKYSGGIKREAYTGRAYIIRNVENYNQQIIPLVLDSFGQLIKDIVLLPSDELKVYSKLNRWENFSISAVGEVKNPGSIDYSIGITLYDVLIMTGGLSKTAENKEIEIVSTYVFDERTNTLEALEKSTIRKVSISKYFESNTFLDTILMHPFDKVYIRNQYVDFPGQVQLLGEVRYPGTYAILSGEETIKDIIVRAGGFTPFAETDAIKLMRTYESSGQVRLILNWDKLKNRKNSRYNYTLNENDNIVIPKIDKTVLIEGVINGVEETNAIATYYKPSRRAKYYINYFAGGFSKEVSKKNITVKYKDGRIRKTKNFIIFKIYPKVKKGSIINVPEKNKRKKRKVNIDGAMQKIMATSTSLLTFIALINLALR